jgi:signal transduction histidine kinase
MVVMATSKGSPPPGAPARQPHNPISRPQIETVVSRSVGIFGLLFGLQAVPAVLEQLPTAQPFWVILFGAGIYGGIVATLVASFAKRGVRAVNAYVSFAYLVALAGWPFVVLDPLAVSGSRPWLWLLATVATSTAAIAFSTWQATAYLIVTPLVYGVVRITPAGGGATVPSASLDVAYAVILGGAVLILITLLRQAAVSVDSAQGTALDRYAHAVRQHATEVERVQVDSIVHDSVLTTLLSASRAFTPEAKDLATRMARNAMGHLKDAAAASPDDDATVELSQLASRIAQATSTLSGSFELRARTVESGSIPIQSSEAVYSAAVQAMVNSLQHAGDGDDVHRWLAIESAEGGGIRIGVGDDGAGFTPDSVPNERLGLRVSIIERVANAGGSVEISAAVDRGVVLWITWPGVRDPAATPTVLDPVNSGVAPTIDGEWQ